MSDERARELVRQSVGLKNDRSTFETHWQDIADVMRPQAYPFTSTETDQGKKRTAKMFDAVPPLALEKHAAVLEALLSPRNQVWSKLATTDEALQEDIEVQRYLDAVRSNLLFAKSVLLVEGDAEEILIPVMFKKVLGLKSGSKEPGKISAGKITRDQLAEVAQTKMVDLNANDLDSAIKIIEGSARAMGLQVEG